MLSYDPCKKCMKPTWEMYLDPSEKYIGPPGTPATFHGSISAIGHVTGLDKAPCLNIRIVIWIFFVIRKMVILAGFEYRTGDIFIFRLANLDQTHKF